MSSEKRTIKKYPNRRLYDTTISSYITLEDVRRLIIEGHTIDVIDAKSEKNLTHSTLVQIMVDQEDKNEPLFSVNVLKKLIRSYGTPSQNSMRDLLENSLKVMEEIQQDKTVSTNVNTTYSQPEYETES